MAARNSPRLQGFSRFLISYYVVAWLLFSAFFIQYILYMLWSRNCLVSVKQRPAIGVYCPFVSFADSML